MKGSPAPRPLPAWVTPYLAGFRDLQRLIVLTEGFVLVPVEIPGPDLAIALGDWLTAQDHPATVIEPRDDDTAWEHLAASLLQAVPAPNGVVIVIGGRSPPQAVYRGLRILNQRRDTIVKHLRCPLLWCGPHSFLDLTWEQAPDFWSIRSIDRRLEPEPRPAESARPVSKAEQAAGPLRELFDAARAQGDKVNAARLGARLADALIQSRAFEEAEAVLEQVLPNLREPEHARPGFGSIDLEAEAEHDLWGTMLLQQAEIARGRGNTIAAATRLSTVLLRTTLDPHLRLRAQLAMASLYEDTGDAPGAQEAYAAALSSARELSDSRGEARALIGLGTIASRPGQKAEGALEPIERARVIAAQLGDAELEAAAIAALAGATARSHDEQRARELLLEEARTRPLQAPGAPYDPSWYVHREEEERIALTHLSTPGAPLMLWGPTLIGKSTLLGHLLDQVRQSDRQDGTRSHIVEVHLDRLLAGAPTSLDALIEALAEHLVRTTGGQQDWVTELGKKRAHWTLKLTSLMENHILSSVDNRLLLSIERADALLRSPIHSDFYAMLRAWGDLGYREPWSRLRLILALSSAPALVINTPNSTSPWNLVAPIELRDFHPSQVQSLAALHGFDCAPGTLDRLMSLVGGHPYLLRIVLHAARVRGAPLDALLDDEGGLHALFSEHLATVVQRLESEPELESAVRTILDQPASQLNAEIYQRLRDAGIVRRDRDGFHVRYPLYERHLRQRWNSG